MVWKQLAVGLQTSRHCWTPIHKAPLDYSTWVTLKSLGLLQRQRGCRGGESLTKKIKTHPIKSYISDRNSDQLNIQNSVRSTWSTSTTTKDTKRSLIYIQPTQSTKSATVGSSLGLWNARSLNGKSAILSDCILSKKIDIMVLTETWFKGNDRDVTTIAEINNILPDHQHRRRFGLSDTVFDWIASFFHHRRNFVSTGKYSSKHHSLQFGVPQGSVLGPLLFCLYISPLEQIFAVHDLKAMLYADDTQLYVVLEESTTTTTVERVNKCLCDIKLWSTSNKLVLNESKTEIIHIHSKHRNMINTLPQIVVNSAPIYLTSDARNLAVVFADNLHFQKQINAVCSSAYLALNSIGKIRRYLDHQTTEKLVHAFVSSRLDQCNSLLYGLPNVQLDKLQRVQNCAARLVTCNNKYTHITPILRELHWLPIKARIEYKIILLTYKSLKGLAPHYLRSLLSSTHLKEC